jgi:hypothetical protein
MSEADVVNQLVNLTSILLAGISVLFTVISAYVAALNYFIGGANFTARLAAFVFLSMVLGLLAVVIVGAQATHDGLIAQLEALQHTGAGLSAAGRSLLANAQQQLEVGGGLSVDATVRIAVWACLALIYLALFYMTFFHRWSAEVTRVAIEPNA